METNVYLGVDESKQKAGTKEKTARKIDVDKIVGGINKGTQLVQASAGLADSTRALLGKSKPGSPAPIEVNVPVGNDSTKKPMSTTTKVLIGVGAVVVIGAIIYFVKKK
jgi:hypothetical protein